MTFGELLPWLNLLLPAVLGYVISIERRLVKLETAREVEREARQDGGHWTHRRSTDAKP